MFFARQALAGFSMANNGLWARVISDLHLHSGMGSVYGPVLHRHVTGREGYSRE